MKKKASSVSDSAQLDPGDVAELFSRRFSPALQKPKTCDGAADGPGIYDGLLADDFSAAHFRMGFEIFSQQKDSSYFFLFAPDGTMSVGMGQPAAEGNAGFATSSYGLAIDSVLFVSGLRKMMLFVEKQLVNDRLSRLIDNAVSTDVVFETVVDPSAGRIPAFVSYVSFLSDGEFGRMIDDSPIASRQMSNTLVDLLLEVWPHNFSHMFKRAPVSVAPRHVKRAIEHIHAHPQTELTVERLSEVCGVSIRALQYGFRNFLGISIGQYERQVRLAGARRSMIDHSELTVAEIAKIWNFSNIHRFSMQFRQAFGVLPSEFRQSHRL